MVPVPSTAFSIKIRLGNLSPGLNIFYVKHIYDPILKNCHPSRVYFDNHYLIRTPVPHGGHGHANNEAGPRQVRVHWVSEYVKGIISRDAAGRVGHTDWRDGVSIALHQTIPASNLSKASTWEQSDNLNHKMLVMVTWCAESDLTYWSPWGWERLPAW